MITRVPPGVHQSAVFGEEPSPPRGKRVSHIIRCPGAYVQFNSCGGRVPGGWVSPRPFPYAQGFALDYGPAPLQGASGTRFNPGCRPGCRGVHLQPPCKKGAGSFHCQDLIKRGLARRFQGDTTCELRRDLEPVFAGGERGGQEDEQLGAHHLADGVAPFHPFINELPAFPLQLTRPASDRCLIL